MCMNPGTLLLVTLLCSALTAGAAVAENYMGGEIVLGGSGPRTISVTEIPATAAQAPAATQPQAVAATGSVSIQTSPSGAAIFIDGVRQGISPAVIPGLSPGSHTLVLKRDGYFDLSVPVSVTGGQTKDYALVLTPLASGQAATPAPPTRKTPGFCVISGIAALGAVLVANKNR